MATRVIGPLDHMTNAVVDVKTDVKSDAPTVVKTWPCEEYADSATGHKALVWFPGSSAPNWTAPSRIELVEHVVDGTRKLLAQCPDEPLSANYGIGNPVMTMFAHDTDPDSHPRLIRSCQCTHTYRVNDIHPGGSLYWPDPACRAGWQHTSYEINIIQ
jgi:hypothetical protein